MKKGQPSQTAKWVAYQRALHQVFDAPPHVLEDPLAVRIPPEPLQAQLAHGDERSPYSEFAVARPFLVARSRYTEEQVARAVAAGVGQYVILGAGLDTFAYRNPFDALRVFEVDHPDTQAWKRERLAAAGIALPPNATFAPVDFETQSLAEGLAAVGFRDDQPTFFGWMGVSYYLTPESFRATLAFIAARPPGSGLAMDYVLPRQQVKESFRSSWDEGLKRVAAQGEPLRLTLSAEQVRAELTGVGLTRMEDIDDAGVRARCLPHHPERVGDSYKLVRLASAWVRAATDG